MVFEGGLSSMKIAHVALRTGDLERMKAFYVDFFEGEAGEKYVNLKKGYESYFITFTSGANLEITRESVSLDHPDENIRQRLGYSHLAFGVGSEIAVNELTNRLRRNGYQVVSEPRITGEGYYVSCILDPDGNLVEITV
jgi:lactoylglutathione lyase